MKTTQKTAGVDALAGEFARDDQIARAAWREYRDMLGCTDGEVWGDRPPRNFVLDELGYRPGDTCIRDTLKNLTEINLHNMAIFVAQERREQSQAKRVRVSDHTCPRCSGDVLRAGELCQRCHAENVGGLDSVTEAASGKSRASEWPDDAAAAAKPIHRSPVEGTLWPRDAVDWSRPDGGRREIVRTASGAPKRARKLTPLQRVAARGIATGATIGEIASRADATTRGAAKARDRMQPAAASARKRRRTRDRRSKQAIAESRARRAANAVKK